MRRLQDQQLDRDHDLVITHFEALSHLTQWSPEGRQENLALIQQLLDYVSGHFLREQQLMATQGYPGLEAHAAAHAELSLAFQGLEARMAQARFTVQEELHLLRQLFLAHIVTWDESFGEWLALEEAEQKPRRRTQHPAAS